MARTILCLLLLAAHWGAAQEARTAANSASRVLILENSTMPLPTARATLIIGPLTRTNGIYAGDFKVRVFPYFFKSDRGRLAINVPDKALAEINQGKAVALTGISISTKNGIVRHIEITATPKDRDHGSVSLWFMVGDLKMIFNPAYQFTNHVVTTALAPRPPLIMSFRQSQAGLMAGRAKQRTHSDRTD
jgi:hypothetical protein